MSRSAIRDPFYQEIVEALAKGSISPDAFERCAVDLLRNEFSGIALVPGGNDGGYDGAIPNPDGGRWWPLVSTTGKDVERNLRENLKTVRKERPNVSVAVFATTQALNADRRKALSGTARKLGFRLHQAFGCEDFALRLYRNSLWCKELLGLTGSPSPLSQIPLTRRPLLDLEPIGREKDIEWLKTSRGHRVLAGEPGSGKTFLLRHLMLRSEWPALFLARPDASDAEIANAVRDQQPKVIVVDDAHVDPSRLASLVRLFREIHAEIDIVAATWLGGRDQVVAALGGLPAAQIRRLELLTRDEIVQVMNQVGLVDIDPHLMRHLVDQASNRPGLAVTIASLARQGSWQELIDGSALEQDVRFYLEAFVGSEARDLLAGFSLGGDRGMGLMDVAEFLKISPSRALQIASGVAAGGVIREVDRIDSVLAVWPRQLRSALLRSVFFSGTAYRLPYKPLFEKVPERAKAVDAIVDALSLGAHLEPKEVLRLVAESGSPSTWSNLAALSRDHGEWVVANFSEDFRSVAAGVLLTAPEPAIEKILELEEEDDAAGRERSDPFFPLRSWIQDLRGAQEATGVAIERRRILVQSVLRFLERGGSQSVGLRAVFLALSPRLESSTLDPGAGRTVTSTRGILYVGDLARLQGIWTLVSGRFSTLDTTAWFALQSAVNGWKSPESRVGVLLDDSYHEPLDQLASLVITDLAKLASGSPGLASGFAELAATMGIELEIGRDPVFDLLFAELSIDPETRVRARAEHEEAVRQLARTWSELSPCEAADKLVFYFSEGQRVGKRWSYFLWVLSDQLALQASRAKDWLQALVKPGVSRNVVQRFLTEVLDRKEEGWADVLYDLLSQATFMGIAVEAALRLEGLPQDLFEEVLARVPDHLHALHMSTAGEIPIRTAKALLLHDSVEVAIAMAAEEWSSEPFREIRAEIRDEWRTALLRIEETDSASIEFRHRDMLASEPEIAAEWIRRNLVASRPHPEAAAVAATLSREQREEILREIASEPSDVRIISSLIARDPDLFDAALVNPHLDPHVLFALAGEVDDSWADLVVRGLAAGRGAAKIAAFSGPRSHFYGGSEAAYWQGLDAQYAKFEGHADAGVREVVRIARGRLTNAIQEGIKVDKELEVHGLHV